MHGASIGPPTLRARAARAAAEGARALRRRGAAAAAAAHGDCGALPPSPLAPPKQVGSDWGFPYVTCVPVTKLRSAAGRARRSGCWPRRCRRRTATTQAPASRPPPPPPRLPWGSRLSRSAAPPRRCGEQRRPPRSTDTAPAGSTDTAPAVSGAQGVGEGRGPRRGGGHLEAVRQLRRGAGAALAAAGGDLPRPSNPRGNALRRLGGAAHGRAVSGQLRLLAPPKRLVCDWCSPR